jgi:hypothetical protein
VKHFGITNVKVEEKKTTCSWRIEFSFDNKLGNTAKGEKFEELKEALKTKYPNTNSIAEYQFNKSFISSLSKGVVCLPANDEARSLVGFACSMQGAIDKAIPK